MLEVTQMSANFICKKIWKETLVYMVDYAEMRLHSIFLVPFPTFVLHQLLLDPNAIPLTMARQGRLGLYLKFFSCTIML